MSNSEGEGPANRHALVGTTLAGRYRILDVLGWGGMGTVYLAEHVTMRRRTALKVIHPGEADDGAIARFARGARNAARIDHPNVCRVFDFGDPPGGVHYLAMEYIDGESLFDVLARETRLETTRAVHIAAQAASALQAAHDIGIVHRDLKPGNIMLTRDASGRELVKVVDFDIAKEMTPRREAEVTTHGWVVGTPEYMSPEQFMGSALDGRSDIYSLGLLTFRMLAGRFPFSAVDPREIMWERLRGHPMTLAQAGAADLPAGLQTALDGAQAPQVEARWSNADAFGRALVGALIGGGTGADAVPGAEASTPRRRPADPLHARADIPRTVAGPTGTLVGDTSRTRGGGRRWVTGPTVGGGALLLASLAALAVWWNPDGQVGEPGDIPRVEAALGGGPEGPVTGAGGPDEAQAGASESDDEDGVGVRERDAGDGRRAVGPAGAPGREGTGDAQERPEAGDEGSGADPPMSAAEARERLGDLNALIGAASAGELDRAQVADRIRIESNAIYEAFAGDDAIRAFAAFIISNAADLVGEEAEALRWAEQASRLAPGSTIYRRWLETLQSNLDDARPS